MTINYLQLNLSTTYFLKKKGFSPLIGIEKTQGKQLARNFAQEFDA